MKPYSLIIAIICGLATAAIMYAPAVTGGPGVVISTLAALPISVSTLGFGTKAGIVSGVIAITTITMLSGAENISQVVTGPLIIVVMPAIWFAHLAGLARNTQDGTEWFPIQKIVTHIAVVTFIVTVAFGVINQYDQQIIQNTISNAYQNIMQQSQLSQTEIQNIAGQTVRIIPVFTPAIIAVMFVLNLWLGSVIARKQKWMMRPKDNIPNATNVEKFIIPTFVASVFLSFVEPINLIAKVMVGATGCVLFLVGLATIHSITIGNQLRTAILTATYVTIIIAVSVEPTIPTLIIITIGITETIFGIRQKIRT